MFFISIVFLPVSENKIRSAVAVPLDAEDRLLQLTYFVYLIVITVSKGRNADNFLIPKQRATWSKVTGVATEPSSGNDAETAHA